MTDRQIVQWAPWPDDLEALVEQLNYDDRWHFALHERYERDYAPDDHRRERAIGGGTTLEVVIAHRNSYPPHDPRRTAFTWPVPPVTWDRENWLLWLFERIDEITRHENMEHFRFELDDGTTWRPLAPLHGPGNDPNRVHVWAPDERRRTSFRGVIKDRG